MQSQTQLFEIGINLRVTECLNQGMRAYMEDFATYYFEKSPDKPDSDRIKFAYFGVFDGHGGTEAAKFAKSHLLNEIKKIEGFWSTDDNLVLEAIKQGFINTHKAMWNERSAWAKTARGLDSTAGTTASIAIVRNRKLYTGHVGDSAIVLGCRDSREQSRDLWHSQALTVEHKPSNPKERERIERAGGSLMRKAGVYRVVWKRPTAPDTPASVAKQQTPQQQQQQFESVPFLAVARSLGDLWSYDKASSEFHVSPEPDVQCISLDYAKHKCLILGSDGLWNMVAPDSAVEMVRVCERSTELKVFTDPDVPPNFFYNPSGSLVQLALHRWTRAGLRADNVTALVVMLDPPGRPMSQLRGEQRDLTMARLGLGRHDSAGPLLEELQATSGLDAAPPATVGIRLADLLIQCDKWQNANRPGSSAAAAAAAAPKQLSGQPSVGNPQAATLKRLASSGGGANAGSDRALFSPALKRRSPSTTTTTSPSTAAADAAAPPPPVFFLPAAPAASDVPEAASAKVEEEEAEKEDSDDDRDDDTEEASREPPPPSRRTTRSSAGSAATIATVAIARQSKPPATKSAKSPTTVAAPSASKRRRVSASPKATAASAKSRLQRLRRRKTLR